MPSPEHVSEHERRRRHLPHWEEPGATYFVTFCLKQGVAVDLTQVSVAPVIIDALRHPDGDRYCLYDYTVMPGHVHMILKPIERRGRSERLWRILQDLKKWTARQINGVLGHSGTLWQDESYDHIIRDARDYEGKAEYILQNPHAAGLIDDPTQWPWWGRGTGPG